MLQVRARAFQGTFTAFADGLNPAGEIAGATIDASNVLHGFVRASNGAITTFDAPGAARAPSKAPTPPASTQRGRFRGFTPTQVT